MFLTDKLIAAQREASRRVAEGKVYSVELPIVGRVPVPSPRQLAIYAALGGLAAIQAIDWPVALAMGVGSALVSRQLSELEEREQELAEVIESDGATKAALKTSSANAVAGNGAATAPAKRAPVKKAAVKKAAKKAPAKKAPVKEAAKKAPPSQRS